VRVLTTSFETPQPLRHLFVAELIDEAQADYLLLVARQYLQRVLNLLAKFFGDDQPLDLQYFLLAQSAIQRQPLARRPARQSWSADNARVRYVQSATTRRLPARR